MWAIIFLLVAVLAGIMSAVYFNEGRPRFGLLQAVACVACIVGYASQIKS